jgi:transposase
MRGSPHTTGARSCRPALISPRDKAKAEVGVQIAERWILASLRNLRPASLAEANDAIRTRLEWLNDRPFAKLDGNRRQLFTDLDRPAIRPLPPTRYEFATWKTVKVNID